MGALPAFVERMTTSEVAGGMASRESDLHRSWKHHHPSVLVAIREL
jgi:hypothetical protein